MSETNIYHGYSGPVEQPRSTSYASDGMVTRRSWMGKEADLPALAVEVGTTDATFGIAGEYTIDPEDGGIFRLTQSFTMRSTVSLYAVFAKVVNPRIEYDVQEIQKPLESSTKFGIVSSTGAIAVDYAMALEGWKNAPTRRKVAFQTLADGVTKADPDNDADWQDLTAFDNGNGLTTLYELAKRVMSGQDSYLIASQIITQITILKVQPTSGSIFSEYLIDTPPGKYSTNSVYLREPDRIVQGQDGNWTVTSRWRGADKWDELFYAPSA